jgi:putative aldouronate transport system permease protein
MKALKNHKKMSTFDEVFTLFISLIMIVFVIVTLYPILNTLALSFNDGTDALRGGVYLWPRIWSLENYMTVMRKQNIITGLRISILRTAVAVAVQLPVTALLAFILSRKDFVFKRQLSLLYVLTMYVKGG